MRLSIVWSLFRKELLETIRDRRTLVIMLVLPIFLYPVFGLIAGQAQVAQNRKLQTTRFVVGVYGPRLPHSLETKLQKTCHVRYIATESQGRQDLKSNRLALLLRWKHHSSFRASSRPSPSTAPTSLLQGPTTSHTTATPPGTPRSPSTLPTSKTSQRPPTSGKGQRSSLLAAAPDLTSPHAGSMQLTLSYISTQSRSRMTLQRVQKALREFQKTLVVGRLHQLQLPQNIIHPTEITLQNLATKQEQARDILARILPLIIVLMTIIGAFYPAIDLTAGEKERGTLETLFTSPISSLEIVTGKYMTVACIAMVTGGLNLLSIWLTLQQGVRLGAGKGGFQLGLQWGDWLAIFFSLLFVAMFSAALMMAIAALARSFKEGQNYVTPAYLFSVLPATWATLPGAEANLSNAILPIVNVSFVIRTTLQGTLTWSYLAVTLLSMGVAVSIALYCAAQIFASEQALFREGDFSGEAWKRPKVTRSSPSIGETILLLVVQFLLLFYVGATVQAKSPTWGLVLTLWGIFLATTLLLLFWRNLHLRDTLSLRAFAPSLLPGLLLIVFCAIPIVATLSDWIGQAFFPGWQDFIKAAQKTFHPSHFGLGPIGFIFLLSVSPGICEEVVFRGFVLRSLRERIAPWLAIVLSSLAFAAFHLSLYRLVPTFIIGCLFGWICLRSRSILPAMLAHALHNATSLGLGWLQSKGLLTETTLHESTVWLLPVCSLGLAAGIYLFVRATQTQDNLTIR